MRHWGEIITPQAHFIGNELSDQSLNPGQGMDPTILLPVLGKYLDRLGS